MKSFIDTLQNKNYWLALGLASAFFVAGCERDRARGTAAYVDDRDISSHVEKALHTDNAYNYPDVKVATADGTVQLSGFVDNSNQKDRAMEITKNITGVKKVENKIALK